MSFANQKGAALVFVIAGIGLIVSLSVGAYYLTSTSAFSGISANYQNQAFHLALAGKEYALINNLGTTQSSGRPFTLKRTDGSIDDKYFRLTISGNVIKSKGIVKEGTPYEVSREITITKTRFGSDDSFDKNIAEFEGGKQESSTGFTNVDTTLKQITLGELGVRYMQSGSVWYAPPATSLMCPDGKCNFGAGFNAFFIFKIDPDYTYDLNGLAHGFTFAVVNGSLNSKSSMGGDYNLPELLSYGGDSRNQSGEYLDGAGGLGIRPPKLAIEFDALVNCCTISSCSLNSRSDSARDHMAYVFWGIDSASCSPNKNNSPTYDDNKHGLGSNPQNATSSNANDTDDYFTGYEQSPRWPNNWLKSSSTSAYAFRVEITRSLTPLGGLYAYTIKSWIKPCVDTSCSNVFTTYPDYNNTKMAYTPTPVDNSILNKSFSLDETDHNKFNTFLFGWTAATGSQSAERVTISNFNMDFK